MNASYATHMQLILEITRLWIWCFIFSPPPPTPQPHPANPTLTTQPTSHTHPTPNPKSNRFNEVVRLLPFFSGIICQGKKTFIKSETLSDKFISMHRKEGHQGMKKIQIPQCQQSQQNKKKSSDDRTPDQRANSKKQNPNTNIVSALRWHCGWCKNIDRGRSWCSNQRYAFGFQ